MVEMPNTVKLSKKGKGIIGLLIFIENEHYDSILKQ